MTSKLYTDKTRRGKTKLLHPDVLVVNLSENKQLALQLTSSRIILGKPCNATQVSSIFSCPVFTQKEDLEWDSKVLDSIFSQTHLFLQHHTDRSISKIQRYLCDTRRVMYKWSSREYKSFGILPVDFSPGFIALHSGRL